MKENIKTKSHISPKVIDAILFLIVFISILGWGYKLGKHIYSKEDINRMDMFLLLLVVFLFYFLVRYINTIKRVIITTKKVKIYSIFKPFGKEYFLENYKAKYITEEYGTEGSYKVLYLIDKEGFTSLKLYGLHYKNMEEIIKNINLPVLKKHLSFKEYVKLLFTGKAKFEL